MTDHHHHTHHSSSTKQELTASYAEAHAIAEPDPGRRVVTVEMEAREFDWEFVPAVSTRAWGFNGTVPGPILEAAVGDVLEIRLTNRLPEPTAFGRVRIAWMPDDRSGEWMYHCHILEHHAAGMMAHFQVIR